MKTLFVVIFCFVLCFCLASPSSALFDSLKNKIQKELDINPFLQKQGMKLRVLDETSGYVTIEMYEGSRKLRKKISEGTDIMTAQVEQQWFLGSSSTNEKESVKILRRTLGVIKSMEEVKEVLLTAIVGTTKDQYEDILIKSKRGQGLFPLLIASEEGNLNLVKYILKMGDDLNEQQTTFDKKTALIAASENNHIDVVRYLLSKGARADLFNENHFPSATVMYILAGKINESENIKILINELTEKNIAQHKDLMEAVNTANSWIKNIMDQNFDDAFVLYYDKYIERRGLTVKKFRDGMYKSIDDMKTLNYVGVEFVRNMARVIYTMKRNNNKMKAVDLWLIKNGGSWALNNETNN